MKSKSRVSIRDASDSDQKWPPYEPYTGEEHPSIKEYAARQTNFRVRVPFLDGVMRVRCVSIGSRGPHATRDSFDRALPRPCRGEDA